MLDERGAIVARYSARGMALNATLSPDQARVLINTFPAAPGQRPALMVRTSSRPAHVLMDLRLPPNSTLADASPWAPDSQTVAYGVSLPVAGGEARLQWRDVAVTTGQTRLLGTTPAINIQALAWSPDGRYILVDRFGPEGRRNGHDSFLLVATNGAGISQVSEALAAALSSGQNVVGWDVGKRPA